MTVESTFKAALPYGIASLAVGTIGAITAVAVATLAMKILGIALAIIGAYGFFATVVCGIFNAGNPKEFRENLPKYFVTFIGHAIADIISKIASEVISNLLDKALGRSGSTIRISQI